MYLYEIWIIINFISLIVDFLIINKIFTYLSKKKTSRNFMFISFLIVIIILFFLNSNSNNEPMIYIFFSIILYYINYETSLV
ncbi:ATP-binding protein, partial [Clostridioides difficile]|nr:ATP-binding protein [Clostridioides difficile]